MSSFASLEMRLHDTKDRLSLVTHKLVVVEDQLEHVSKRLLAMTSELAAIREQLNKGNVT